MKVRRYYGFVMYKQSNEGTNKNVATASVFAGTRVA